MRSAPRILVNVGAIFAVVTFALFGTMVPASASNTTSANIDQCTNGAVGPPIVKEQCAGSSLAAVLNGAPNAAGYKNWVNGDSNGGKSHWREGDFIAYRATVTALVGTLTKASGAQSSAAGRSRSMAWRVATMRP